MRCARHPWAGTLATAHSARGEQPAGAGRSWKRALQLSQGSISCPRKLHRGLELPDVRSAQAALLLQGGFRSVDLNSLMKWLWLR